MKKILFMILIGLSFSGCANVQWCNMRPEWNPSKGYEWAVAECNSRGSIICNPNAFQQAMDRTTAFHSCMKTYGYEQRKVSGPDDPYIAK
jgi:hypothetical protein